MIYYEKERSGKNDYLYNQYDVNLNFSMHLHNNFEFVYVYEGEMKITIEQQTYSLTQGKGCLILPNQIHSYATPEYSKSYLCVFSNNYIGSFYLNATNFISDCPVFAFDRPELIDLLSKPNLNKYLLKSIFYYIVGLFDSNSHYLTKNNTNRDLISKILNYIENNYLHNITLLSLSKELGYDYNYLSNILSQQLNIRFLSLINEYRINHARHLIQSTDKSITQIAIESGYDSIRTFNRNFIALVGMSPSDFKKNSK